MIGRLTLMGRRTMRAGRALGRQFIIVQFALVAGLLALLQFLFERLNNGILNKLTTFRVDRMGDIGIESVVRVWIIIAGKVAAAIIAKPCSQMVLGAAAWTL